MCIYIYIYIYTYIYRDVGETLVAASARGSGPLASPCSLVHSSCFLNN